MVSSPIARLVTRIAIEELSQGNKGDPDVNGDGVFTVGVYTWEGPFGDSVVGAIQAVLDEDLAGDFGMDARVVVEERHPDPITPSYMFGDGLETLMAGEPDVVISAVQPGTYPDYLSEWDDRGLSADVAMYNLHTLRLRNNLDVLGDLIEGQQGAAHEFVADTKAGEAFESAFELETGDSPGYYDSQYYDNAATLMLAAIWALEKADAEPEDLTGEMLRDAMLEVHDPKDGVRIGAGPDEFVKAIEAIRRGDTIDYNGASGPIDYDANGNVFGRLARYAAKDGVFVETGRFDCVESLDCPIVK